MEKSIGTVLKRKTHALFRYPYYVRPNTSDVYVNADVTQNKMGSVQFDSVETIIDAGANIGIRTLWFANRFPNAKIVAIEPETSNYNVLKINTAMYPNICCIQCGLWKSDVKLKIAPLDDNKNKYAFQVTEAIDDDFDVVGITIDAVKEQFNMQRVDILKCDIEGSEIEVFENSASWVNSVNYFIVELHDRIRKGCKRAFFNAIGEHDLLYAKGWDVICKSTRNKAKK
ncbi:MAG: FkbM family methyltransferase [Planctomycetaceae bacterium]|jgi:FkbM family methyltransferase|nr:FkbM family methyltransferase [Planctomycetaceae bacterium]